MAGRAAKAARWLRSFAPHFHASLLGGGDRRHEQCQNRYDDDGHEQLDQGKILTLSTGCSPTTFECIHCELRELAPRVLAVPPMIPQPGEVKEKLWWALSGISPIADFSALCEARIPEHTSVDTPAGSRPIERLEAGDNRL